VNCSSDAGLREALHYLLKSEADFREMQMLRQLMDVQYLLSVVYQNLGQDKERDSAIKRHFSTEEEWKELEARVWDEEVVKIWQLVADIGAALSRTTG
jgi:hypothetical protein